MKEIKLNIEGMHCTGCSLRLERVLNNLEGVKSATVNFEEKQATIIFDINTINEKKIKKAIEDVGLQGK
mgnify:CR=1 FL=1